MNRLLTFLAIMLTASIMAQNTPPIFPLLTKNAPLQIGEQRSGAFIEDDAYTYLVVQHRQLKISADFYGLETFEYLPHHSAYARVANNKKESALRALEAAGGVALGIDPAWRQSRRVFQQDWPEWAWLGNGKMKFWLQYWPGVSPEEARLKATQAGWEVIDEKPGENFLAVAHQPEKVADLIAASWVRYVQEMEDPGEPENFTARTSHRTNFLQQPDRGGLQYDGSGIVVGHNDAGLLGQHIDFKGRLTQVGSSSSTSDHGDHTAGTIFGAGNLDPEAEGMAPGADMFYTLYPNNLNNADQIYTSQNARLTSNSFSNGCNAGYTAFSRQMDRDAFQNPLMLHVFSAGNSGTSNCGYGAGSGWGNVTGGHKVGKNVITVANLTRTDGLAGSSSRGPASDGRIKPDIGAVGTQVFSTTDQPRPNSYARYTGTSMACPGITGSLAVLMQAHKDLYNGQEISGTHLKGYLLNGAEDLGNPGPDFRYGYGRANIRRSFEMLRDGNFFVDSVDTGDSLSFGINVPANTAELKVMLIWADPAASLSASRDLVNDLDLTLSDGGTLYQPWVLDPTPNATALNSDAVRGRDSLNNMEQITLLNPSSGQKTLSVKGFNVPNGKQSFYVVYYFQPEELKITYPLSGAALATGAIEIVRWDAPSQSSGFTFQFSNDGGNNWFTVANPGSGARHFTWTAPGTPSDRYYLRVFDNNDTSTVGPITVVQTPGLINVVSTCPDTVELNWNSSPIASGYVVYRLGAKYMDSLTHVSQNSARLAHNAGQGDWYAVAAVLNDTSVGFRSVAQFKEPGIRNCVLPKDLELVEVISPGRGEIPDCLGSNSLPVTLRVHNRGTDTVFNYQLGFQRSGAAAQTENVSDTLAPGDFAEYTFQSASAQLLNNINLQYTYWIDGGGNDQNPFNDTLVRNIRLFASGNIINQFPYQEDFETFSRCRTDADCGLTVCSLDNGWTNATNFSADAIDFRVNLGSTPSNGTGPNFDHNPGNSGGQYLYTEASGDCDSAEALLLSPCLDLSQLYNPEASIYYHMNGTGHMGVLSVDVYDGTYWHLDWTARIEGDQGSNWQQLKINLQPFAGNKVVLRFRAKTGSDFRSDIALDDFSAYDRSGVGLDELAQGTFRLYPNPSEGTVFLEKRADLSADATLYLRDMSGALLWRGSFEANAGQNKMKLDLSQRAKGLYLLEVEHREGRQSMRLMKH